MHDQCVITLIRITAGLEVIFFVFSLHGWDLNLYLYAFLFDVFMNMFNYSVSVPVPLLSASLWLIQIMAFNYYNRHYNINSASIMIVKFVL